jgi:transcriptional regulator with PAS, ATPase and Fis domain
VEDMKALKRQLSGAGKLDRLSIFSQMIQLQCKERDPDFITTYEKAIAIFRDYLEFDPNPVEAIRIDLCRIFYNAFQAIRYFAGGTFFTTIYSEFVQYEKFISDLDFQALIYADLSFLWWQQSNMEKAISYALKSVSALDKSGNQNILPGRYSNLGFIYECQGDFLKAEKCYQKGMNFGLKVNSDRVCCLAYMGFGRLNMLKGNSERAMHYLLEALKYAGDEYSEDYLTICSSLGITLGKLGKFEHALEYFSKLISEDTKASNPEMYFSTLMNTANCYRNMDELDKSESNLLEVIEFGKTHGNLQAVSGALINLGHLETKRENWEKAIGYYSQSKSNSELTGNKHQDILSNIGMGTVWSVTKEYDKAIDALNNAISAALAMNMRSELKEAYFQLSKLYEAIGQFQKALDCHKKYKIYDIEILDEKYNLDLKNLKEDYQRKDQKQGNERFYHTQSLISKELALLVKTPFIGTSKAIQDMVNVAFVAAKQDSAPVLITGESGTGKEIIARIIHYAGKRKNHPFVSVNSSAFSNTLIESAFFGSEKGSFTGSAEKKLGYFESVQNGTLFLDEVGNMPLSMQSKLLRVVEDHVIHRVGSTKDIALNFRLISATNSDLHRLSQQNEFRFDLLNRINTLVIHIPPLRERMGDIPLLIDYFIDLYSEQQGITKPIFTKETLEFLINYNYPGNVRELRNIIQRSILLCSKPVVEPDDIIFSAGKSVHEGDGSAEILAFPESCSLSLANWERKLIRTAMQQSGNVQAKAAKLLGISPYSLNRKLKNMN